MKICILAEGSYPYVLGGVSSWINTLIRSCPEHEFIIYAIGADSSKKGQYKYEIPSNVESIVEVFLDNMELQDGIKGKQFSFKEEHKDALQNLLNGDEFSWDSIFEFFNKGNFKNMTEFFMSKNFFNLVKGTYKDKYPYTPFTEFLWTIRSMYTTLFYLLTQKMPKADIYHSVSTGYAGILAAYGKYLYGSPFILSEHGIYTREREEEIIKSNWIKGYHKEIWIKFFVNLSRAAYESSDLVISLFEDNKELQIGLGCPEDKIVIIPNGVDVSLYENIPKKEDDSVINIGTIARVVSIKDIKTMLLSFQVVKQEVPNAKFYIMGPTEEDEEYYEECKHLVEHLKIQDVQFTGTIKVLDYIGKMDMLVLTSISEGQPLSIMEGMAAKKPQVCTNVGHCRGLLYGDGDYYGKSGFICYVMDYIGIGEAIIKLCKDKDLRETMGQNGYERVISLYTKSGFINKYKDLYENFNKEVRQWQE